MDKRTERPWKVILAHGQESPEDVLCAETRDEISNTRGLMGEGEKSRAAMAAKAGAKLQWSPQWCKHSKEGPWQMTWHRGLPTETLSKNQMPKGGEERLLGLFIAKMVKKTLEAYVSKVSMKNESKVGG